MSARLLFLDPAELEKLTGRKTKSKQIEWLRGSGVPFRINATGHPVVTRATIEGGQEPAPQSRAWSPRVVGA